MQIPLFRAINCTIQLQPVACRHSTIKLADTSKVSKNTDNTDLAAADADAELEQRLNSETGRISWTELERYFARGVLLLLDNDEDLVNVAASMVRDDSTLIAGLMERGKLRLVEAEDAQHWQQASEQQVPVFWAVVAAPWVLVQLVAD